MVAGIGLTGNCRLGTWRLQTAARLILLQGLGTGIMLQGFPTVTPCCATIARQWTWIGSGCRLVLGTLPRTGVKGTWRRCIHGPDREHAHERLSAKLGVCNLVRLCVDSRLAKMNKKYSDVNYQPSDCKDKLSAESAIVCVRTAAFVCQY